MAALGALGFEGARARAALAASGGNVDRAASSLLDGSAPAPAAPPPPAANAHPGVPADPRLSGVYMDERR